MNNALELLPQSEQAAMATLFSDGGKTRKDILDFEAYIKNLPNAFDECPYELFHSFANGMYTREIHIPAGDIAVGKIHRDDYFVNVIKGKLWVMSEYGSKEITAPASFVAKAGVKHIVYTLEDTVWADTHKTDKTTIEEAEKEIFVDSYQELDRLNGIIEYTEMCRDIGLTIEQAHELSRIDSDLIEQPDRFIEIKNSPIEGQGVFGTIDFNKGDLIAVGRDGECRTPAGRYTNHSALPNAEALILDDKGYFFALENIAKDSEITVDYREVRKKAMQLDRYKSCLDG